jgi:hypothetical protein
MEKNQAYSDYVNFLNQYLKDNIDALIWVLAYSTYVHGIDDIIDKDNTESEHILKTFELAAVIYSYPFYLQNLNILYPLVIMASNTYMDSVKLENQPEVWKQRVSDALRQTGNEVILACIQIVGGVDIRREASMKLREISWRTHHTIEGVPV